MRPKPPNAVIITTRRIGVDGHMSYPWRHHCQDNPTIHKVEPKAFTDDERAALARWKAITNNFWRIPALDSIEGAYRHWLACTPQEVAS